MDFTHQGERGVIDRSNRFLLFLFTVFDVEEFCPCLKEILCCEEGKVFMFSASSHVSLPFNPMRKLLS